MRDNKAMYVFEVRPTLVSRVFMQPLDLDQTSPDF